MLSVSIYLVTIYCPVDITQTTDPGMPTALVTWPDIIANDTTGMVFNVTSNYTSGDAFSIGSTEVMYWVEGDEEIACSFNVTVEGKDNEKCRNRAIRHIIYSMYSSNHQFVLNQLIKLPCSLQFYCAKENSFFFKKHISQRYTWYMNHSLPQH